MYVYVVRDVYMQERGSARPDIVGSICRHRGVTYVCVHVCVYVELAPAHRTYARAHAHDCTHVVYICRTLTSRAQERQRPTRFYWLNLCAGICPGTDVGTHVGTCAGMCRTSASERTYNCVYTYAPTHAPVYAPVYVLDLMCARMYMSAFVCAPACTCACVRVHVCAPTYARPYVCAPACVHAHGPGRMYVWVCT